MGQQPSVVAEPGISGSLYDGTSTAASGDNCAVADFIHVDGARNIIYDARTKNRTPIAVVGLRDLILDQTDDAVLLAHKSQAQKVKELVRKLAEDAKLKKLV